MNGSIHLHIILVYNLFPFQVLFLCILKVWMIKKKQVTTVVVMENFIHIQVTGGQWSFRQDCKILGYKVRIRCAYT